MSACILLSITLDEYKALLDKYSAFQEHTCMNSG